MHIVHPQHVRHALWANASPSKHFLHKRVDIWQRLAVRGCREAVTEESVELRLCVCLHVRIQRHRKEEGIDRGDGLVTRRVGERGGKVEWVEIRTVSAPPPYIAAAAHLSRPSCSGVMPCWLRWPPTKDGRATPSACT